MGSKMNVIQMPTVEPSPWDRLVLPISLERFSICDDREEWVGRDEVGGFIILQYPRIALICGPDGSCVLNSIAETDLSVIFDDEPIPLSAVA